MYPDAQHGFNADYRPSYKKDDAQDAWKKMLTFFKKAGVWESLRVATPGMAATSGGGVCPGTW